MQYVEFIAVLAVAQYFFFGMMTGKARAKSGLKAPAVVGDEGFERMYRVQMNTLEVLVMFLPALLIAGRYWSSLLVAAIGLVYLIGRFAFWRAYITEPSKRAVGFVLSIVPIAILILLSLAGIVLA